jgi:hypothetical protein
VNEREQVLWTGTATARFVLMVLLVVGLAGVLRENILIVAIALAVGAVFSGVRVVVSTDRVVVRSAVGIPFATVPLADIEGVEAEDIPATGRWGVRWRPGERSIVVRSGEALRIHRTTGTDLLVGVDDAREGADTLRVLLGRPG